MRRKSDFLKTVVQHYDMKRTNVVPLVEAMGRTAFSARDLSSAAVLYDRMLRDPRCSIILSLAGSLVSAGLKKVLCDLIDHDMVDVVVSTGANIVDQDFFEAVGYRHYQGSPDVDDDLLRQLGISRIYDTYIDEEQLGEVDRIVTAVAAGLDRRPYSSREFIRELARHLRKDPARPESILLSAFRRGVPIFVPAFSDCAAGFGLLNHQVAHPRSHVTIDSVRDFRELAAVKKEAEETGLLMVGGGVPKNFVQDVALATPSLGRAAVMHKYAIQITVADVRDGALSSSTLKEACSWGKVSIVNEQMVYAEATLALPLIAGYAYHKGGWKGRRARNYNRLLDGASAPPVRSRGGNGKAPAGIAARALRP
jgi:deoxyhypusine synthase